MARRGVFVWAQADLGSVIYGCVPHVCVCVCVCVKEREMSGWSLACMHDAPRLGCNRGRDSVESGSASGKRQAGPWSGVRNWPTKDLTSIELLRNLTITHVYNTSPPSHTHHRLHPPNMGDESRKRSRFDQAEPEPPRRSKFDRRSRSPPHGDSERATRSRSPVVKTEGSSGTKRDAAAAAAEAAARINAQLSQKKAPQHVDVPPIRAVWPCPGKKTRLEEDADNSPSRPTLPALFPAVPSPPLPAIVVPSMSRSTSKMVITLRTSKSMTCVTATP